MHMHVGLLRPLVINSVAVNPFGRTIWPGVAEPIERTSRAPRMGADGMGRPHAPKGVLVMVDLHSALRSPSIISAEPNASTSFADENGESKAVPRGLFRHL